MVAICDSEDQALLWVQIKLELFSYQSRCFWVEPQICFRVGPTANSCSCGNTGRKINLNVLISTINNYFFGVNYSLSSFYFPLNCSFKVIKISNNKNEKL